ncbi:hypothetical protein Tsubulata_018410 [Turnera subulata]|uniref:Uncharacterized protein n=1 Tax=Turnera subulata TaxID=218843 RepID=A0A9Q0JLB1_9ROSI|nr:hypothetical protein Tsubulata_018410 [Turnera subulata]
MADEKVAEKVKDAANNGMLRLVLLFIAGLVVLIGFLIFLVWLILQPKKPEFILQDITLYSLNITQPNYLTTSLQVTLTTKNPNAKVGISYEKVDVFASYHNQQITDRCNDGVSGFTLDPNQSTTLQVNSFWSGRVWGRTNCTQDPSGKFTCATGDCNSSSIECFGKEGASPLTVAEFHMNHSRQGFDFFDVTLANGFNIPMLVQPQGGLFGQGNCSATGCVPDMNSWCPPEVRVVGNDGVTTVACQSACQAFGTPEYCCSGEYDSRESCKPSSYSEILKNACPRARTFAYDDDWTSTFTCAGADYVITFCPTNPFGSLYGSESKPSFGEEISNSEPTSFDSGIEPSSDESIPILSTSHGIASRYYSLQSSSTMSGAIILQLLAIISTFL